MVGRSARRRFDRRKPSALEVEKSYQNTWCPCCTTAQVARMVRRLDGRRRRRDAPLFAGHEYAIPATGTVKYDCTSATGEP